MDTGFYREWLNRRLRNADQLVQQFVGEGEPDAFIILCCCLSAFAARRWPGPGADKRRYIELLVRFCDLQPSMTLVSAPILVQNLEIRDPVASSILRKSLFPESDALVVARAEIDRPEDAFRSLVPGVPLKEIREASYAAIMYGYFRSSLVHEFSLSPRVSEFPMSRTMDLHYVSVFTGKPGKEIMHLPFFPYTFVRQVVENTALRCCDAWDSASTWKGPQPKTWWIQGQSPSAE
jgi:hypothetical protein